MFFWFELVKIGQNWSKKVVGSRTSPAAVSGVLPETPPSLRKRFPTDWTRAPGAPRRIRGWALDSRLRPARESIWSSSELDFGLCHFGSPSQSRVTHHFKEPHATPTATRRSRFPDFGLWTLGIGL
jgi:hypothetical protein